MFKRKWIDARCFYSNIRLVASQYNHVERGASTYLTPGMARTLAAWLLNAADEIDARLEADRQWW